MPRKIRTIVDIRSEARKHTILAMNTLVGIMSSPKAPTASRVAAAGIMLDRGWGKAKTVVTGDENEPPIEVITRIIIAAGQGTRDTNG